MPWKVSLIIKRKHYNTQQVTQLIGAGDAMGFLDDQVNPILLPTYKRSTTVWEIWDHADIC